MEGAVRVFAGEFGRSTLSVAGVDDGSSGFVVTPGGAYCRHMFLAGALTEVDESGDIIRARVADPTGGFDLFSGGKNPDLTTLIRNVSLPAFVSVLGRAQLYRRNGTVSLSVRPDHIVVIDRATRDRWVLGTAVSTLRRLEETLRVLRNQGSDERILTAIRHYRMTERDLDGIAAMAETAVQSVRPPGSEETEKADAKSLVLELLTPSKGPRGMAVQEIIETLAGTGVSQESVLAAIESLIVEDECYQPQKGYIRLL